MFQFGQSQSITSITHVPANPTTNDNVSIVVNTSMPTSGCWVTTSSISTVGSTHSLFGAHCSGLAQTVCSGSDTFFLGLLNPGVQTVDYTMYYGGLAGSQTQCTSFSFGDSSMYQFSVAAGAGNLPAVIHPEGEHIQCDGDSFFVHTDEVVGQSYQWMFHGQPIPDDTNYFHWASDSGFYQVRIYFNGDSGTSPTLLLTSHSRPGGPLTLTEDLISTGYAADTFQWHSVQNGIIAGADSHIVQVSQDGDYFVSMVNSHFCYGNSDTLYVEFVEAEIDPAGIIEVCASDSLKLTATPTGSQYQYSWLRNGVVISSADSNTFKPTLDGNYQVRVSISQSYDTSGASSVTLIPSPTPIISYDGSMLSPLSTWNSYQWYSIGAGLIVGADSMQHTPLTNGTFYLRVADSTGCEGISNSVSVDGLAIEDLEASITHDIRVNGNEIQLIFNSKFKGQILARDVQGKLLYQDNVVSDLYLIDASSWSQGIYLLTLQGDSGAMETHKLFID